MVFRGSQNLVFSAIVLILILSVNSSALENKNDIIKKYFYAERLFLEGKYEKAKEEFNKILINEPGHMESLNMILECNDKILLTRDLINQSLTEYRKGSVIGSLKKLDEAFNKDDVNFEVKSLLIKILTELGMEYSFVGQNEKSLIYLMRAQELAPANEIINDLIKLNKSVLASMDLDTEKDLSKIDEFKVTLMEYNKKQKNLAVNYQLNDSDTAEFIKGSKREEEKLHTILRSRKGQVIKVMNLKLSFWSVILIVTSIIIGALFFIVKIKKKVLAINDNKNIDLEYEKKLKKLHIIEQELSGKDTSQSQVALNMLEQFLDDKDYRIRLRVIRVLHGIDAKMAVGMLKDIISKEDGKYKKSALELLSQLTSSDSIALLLQFTEDSQDDIKENAVAYLSKIINENNIDNNLKLKITNRLNDIYHKEGWISE